MSTRKTIKARELKAFRRGSFAFVNQDIVGPGNLQFVQADEVSLVNTTTNLVGILVDSGCDLLFIDNCKLGYPGKGAVLVNGRYKGWKRVEISDTSFGGGDHDLLHFGVGWTKDSHGNIDVPPVTGFITRSIFSGVTEGKDQPHADAIQAATATVDLEISETVFRQTRSSLQITPLQNGANRPGTGSGESTGYGCHRRLKLIKVTLDNAGAARIFNAPELSVIGVKQFGHGTFDVRYTQVCKPIKGKPYRPKHPASDCTYGVIMQDSEIETLIWDPLVSINLDESGNNNIGRILATNGSPMSRIPAQRIKDQLK